MRASDISRGRRILARFLALAEERLAYLVELYETGRWQRYFTQDELLENVRDAKTAVTAWKLLVSTEALPNNHPVDLSWLDSSRPLPPRKPLMLHVDQQPRMAVKLSIAAPASTQPVCVDFRGEVEPIRFVRTSPAPVIAAAPAPAAPPPKPDAWQNSLDFALMRERYPLLRKTG